MMLADHARCAAQSYAEHSERWLGVVLSTRFKMLKLLKKLLVQFVEPHDGVDAHPRLQVLLLQHAPRVFVEQATQLADLLRLDAQTGSHLVSPELFEHRRT